MAVMDHHERGSPAARVWVSTPDQQPVLRQMRLLLGSGSRYVKGHSSQLQASDVCMRLVVSASSGGLLFVFDARAFPSPRSFICEFWLLSRYVPDLSVIDVNGSACTVVFLQFCTLLKLPG